MVSRIETKVGIRAETWLGLQVEYDIRVAKRQAGEKIARRVRRREAA